MDQLGPDGAKQRPRTGGLHHHRQGWKVERSGVVTNEIQIRLILHTIRQSKRKSVFSTLYHFECEKIASAAVTGTTEN